LLLQQVVWQARSTNFQHLGMAAKRQLLPTISEEHAAAYGAFAEIPEWVIFQLDGNYLAVSYFTDVNVSPWVLYDIGDGDRCRRGSGVALPDGLTRRRW